jgi:hypothetical protein
MSILETVQRYRVTPSDADPEKWYLEQADPVGGVPMIYASGSKTDMELVAHLLNLLELEIAALKLQLQAAGRG